MLLLLLVVMLSIMAGQIQALALHLVTHNHQGATRFNLFPMHNLPCHITLIKN
jgi:hypothetical protein